MKISELNKERFKNFKEAIEKTLLELELVDGIKGIIVEDYVFMSKSDKELLATKINTLEKEQSKYHWDNRRTLQESLKTPYIRELFILRLIHACVRRPRRTS